jgi:hypothetical protein
MEITQAMMRAAQQAEFAYYQRNRGPHDRFRPMADGLLRAVIETAISAIGHDDEPEPEPPAFEPEEEAVPEPPPQTVRIVRARKPKPRRYGDR